MRRWLIPAAAVLALAAAAPFTAASAASADSGGSTLFIRSAVEHPDGTATFPLHHGTSQSRTVYYLLLDSSDGNGAAAIGVNKSQKLANAANTDAIQHVTVTGGVDHPARVDFSPAHVLEASNCFPLTRFEPGAVGEAGYSPLIQRPDGSVDNAPQIARDQNGDGRIDLLTEAADKVVAIDTAHLTVTYKETDGFHGGKAVRYVSTDSTDPLAATLEDATLAPALNAAPRAGDDSTASSRAELVAFANGRTGAANRQRQGLNGSVALIEPGDGQPGATEEPGRMRRPRAARRSVDRSEFAGFRFPPDVIAVAVRWYLRYGLSYRDVEELLAERGVAVDHVTVYRWVQRFTPLFAEAARPLRHATGDRWFVDETYVKVAGRWRYLYRAVDQYGQVIDVLLSGQRDTAAARRFFTRALRHGPAPVEVTTDKAGPYLRVLDEIVPAAAHITEQYDNNPIESDHARLKARLWPMPGLTRFRSAEVIAGGHAFVQNLCRGHYELATDAPPPLRLATAFAELALAM